MRFARHKWLLWSIAVIITLGSVVYQRMTGPTYPLRGKAKLGEQQISFKLLRSETVDKDAAIRIAVNDTSVQGVVQFRRYKSHDEWTFLPLLRQDNVLSAELPRQPAAGKLMYFVYLQQGSRQISLSADSPVILRYKGSVPLAVLIPHVLIMFLAMLFSNRTALETLDPSGKDKKFMFWTIALLFTGGFILGPAVQKYAFDAYWTGFPFGFDLTDNKTLVAMLGWLWAWYKNRSGHRARGWIMVAAVLQLLVYLIPHSVLGSEIDHTRTTLQS